MVFGKVVGFFLDWMVVVILWIWMKWEKIFIVCISIVLIIFFLNLNFFVKICLNFYFNIIVEIYVKNLYFLYKGRLIILLCICGFEMWWIN